MPRETVIKFGGTSVKTADAMNNAITIIECNPAVRVVVVSAVGGVTNKLVQFFQAPVTQRQEILLEIELIHLNILKHLGRLNHLLQVVAQLIHQLDTYCTMELSAAELDEIVSLGETLSSLILYHCLKQKKSPVVLLDAKKIIITDDHFGKATPQLDLIKSRCEAIKNYPDDTVIITQGFIGATLDGRTTTLGRGGSDFSAALIAEAIDADRLCIYTDVKGVYTTDPNIINNAQLIPHLRFQEMAELANFGAKILHPATLAPCARAKIPVTILSTFAPTEGSTCIVPDGYFSLEKSAVIRAIALRKEQILVTIKSLKMLNACGFLAHVFSILARNQISVDLITTSEVSIALTIDGTNLGSHGINPFKNQAILNELNEFSDISIEDSLALITVVGEGLTIPGISQNILSKVKDYPIRLICYGASSSNIGFLVKTEDAHSVVAALHKEFIEETPQVIDQRYA